MKFTNTRIAMAEFDASQPTRDALFEAIDSNETANAYFAAEESALDKVRLAFFEDTKDINVLANCMIVEESFLRRMCNLKDDNE